MLTSSEIRQQFIEYFASKRGHRFVPSSPVIPHDDPTLLFTNAGMNQFKPLFLGTGTADYTRAANTQKCIRAGGKHNDLEDVGKDTYHHTFFEMLGNWSFGDYFKREAIEWAWELLTKVWGIDPTRLHATYFQGDPAENLEPDIEARDIWREILPADHVHPGNKKDNFWEMGDAGPCGPCSEIHIDRTPDKAGGHLVNKGDARVMEIWNLVFIQFNRAPGVNGQAGKLSPLPAKHVDTGMGFERLCSVIQNKSSNYDTDVFTPVFERICQVTGARPYAGKLDDSVDIAYRILADHIRCLTFALTDGALPSNEGRGYVLRRILRRAVRHGRQTLGVKNPFFHQLVPGVVDAMGQAFPELKKNPQHVMDVIKEEEVSFGRTLDRGIELFEQAVAHSQASGSKQVGAEDAFKLYDTYGFPLDLTQVMAEERAMTVDVAGFEALMEQQRKQSRAGGAAVGDGQISIADALLELVAKQTLPASEFVGYVEANLTSDIQTTVQAYPLAQGMQAVVLGKTPFYGEKGGQVGDTGTLTINGQVLPVIGTYCVGDAYVHVTEFAGVIACDDQKVGCRVDVEKRKKIVANHTATHVMNHKLRAVLGEHVMQKGSLVDEGKTRFDFAHQAAMTDPQVQAVQEMVAGDVGRDLPVYAEEAAQADAMKIHGLRAVFGEKYPPRVRVVSIGQSLGTLLSEPGNKKWYDYSVEFCGGTHVKTTGQIGGFVIISEEAVGKGIRRLTAVTGQAAQQAQQKAKALSEMLEKPADVAAAVAKVNEIMAGENLPFLEKSRLRDRMTALQKELKQADKARGKEMAAAAAEEGRRLAEAEKGPVIVAEISQAGGDAESLRAALEVLSKKRPDAAVLLATATMPDKAAFAAVVCQALIAKGLKAGDWVKEAAKVAGGSGGGRPDMAQAGGKDASKLPQALEAARQFAAAKLG